MTDKPPELPSNRPSAQPPDASKTIGGWMFALLWLLVLGGGSLFAQQWLSQREAAAAPEWVEVGRSQPALKLKSDRYGQYHIVGSANGQKVPFLLDTGASEISISGDAAERLNLRRGRSYPVITANGTVRVYATTLNSIKVGPFQLENVQAHINPGMSGDFALLGMSFLRHFELLQRSGELTISVP